MRFPSIVGSFISANKPNVFLDNAKLTTFYLTKSLNIVFLINENCTRKLAFRARNVFRKF